MCHFIKIIFINKGMEFIDLKSFFIKDKSVISSVPNYFNKTVTPIICYKYNTTIRFTIFNFNKIVMDMNIVSKTPEIVIIICIHISLHGMLLQVI